MMGQTTGFKGIGTGTSKWKKTVYAVVEILDDDADLNGSDGHQHFVTDWSLGKALEKFADGPIGDTYMLFDGVIKEDSDYKMPDKEESIPWYTIRGKDIPTKVSKSRSVACCAFNATNDYMQHWLGLKLDHHDKSWYTDHNLVTTDGLPQAHSFTVIQQLVEPYGVGISRIFVPRNNRRFKEYSPFIRSLGVNPFFAVDGHTTNEEALEKLYPGDKETQDRLRDELFAKWRFECVDSPPGGAITMTQFESKMVGHNGASTYRGVRAPFYDKDWKMAIKLDRLDRIDYIKPVELPDYREFEGQVTYDFWGIKDAKGKTVRGYSTTGGGHSSPGFRGQYSGSPVHSFRDYDDYESWSDIWGWDDYDDDKRPSTQADRDAQRALLDGSSASKAKSFSLTYPPVCENCQRDPGLRYVGGSKLCQHCDAVQEKNWNDPFVGNGEIKRTL